MPWEVSAVLKPGTGIIARLFFYEAKKLEGEEVARVRTASFMRGRRPTWGIPAMKALFISDPNGGGERRLASQLSGVP